MMRILLSSTGPGDGIWRLAATSITSSAVLIVGEPVCVQMVNIDIINAHGNVLSMVLIRYSNVNCASKLGIKGCTYSAANW